MNESNNEVSAMPEGFSAVSTDELDHIEGGSIRDAMFELLKGLVERYDQTAKNVIQSVGR